MNISIELIKIAITFFPGVLITLILQLFNQKNKVYSNFQFVMYSFINGVFIFILLYFFNLKDIFFSETKDIIAILQKLPSKTIFFILLITILTGLTMVYIRGSALIHLITLKLRVSFGVGFPTLLDAIYNSKERYMVNLQDSIVHIKLLDGSADYYGILAYYEIYDDSVEFIIKDVDIRFKNNPYPIDNPSIEYDKDSIYLNLKKFTFQIEYTICNEKEFSFKEVIKEKIRKNRGIIVIFILWFLLIYFKDFFINPNINESTSIYYFINILNYN